MNNYRRDDRKRSGKNNNSRRRYEDKRSDNRRQHQRYKGSGRKMAMQAADEDETDPSDESGSLKELYEVLNTRCNRLLRIVLTRILSFRFFKKQGWIVVP
jgi:hypothetical protein